VRDGKGIYLNGRKTHIYNLKEGGKES
jgi:hypothetical protein